MDSRLSWLDSTLQGTRDSSNDNLAPPPVSFGFTSNTDLQKPPQDNKAYYFANASADNLGRNEQPDESEDSISLSLTAQDLTLEESKTYMRWYSDILVRTNSRTITMNDVYQFLSNFRLSAEAQEKINRIFSKILSSINIGEFFALLRVVSHTLAGEEPSRKLIKIQTNVPTPPSILSKKRQNDDTEEEPKQPVENPDSPSKPLDLDSFTQFMLTGERPEERTTKKRSKKLKSVKFSDQIVTDIHVPSPDKQPNSYISSSGELDYSLPMDQLLDRLNASKAGPSGNNNSLLVPQLTPGPIRSPDPEEKEILKDMEPQINHFQHLNSVDTMSVDGVPANIHLSNQGFYTPSPREGSSSPQPQLLKPNMTGPAQMAQIIGVPPQDQHQPQPSPLRSNITGPADMARLLSPDTGDPNAPKISLQSFTSQMTGDTLDNTARNARISDDRSPPPPVPTRRNRSVSQPNFLENDHPQASSPLPTSNGDSASQGAFQRYRSASLSPAMNGPPVPPRSPLHNTRPGPPPPPPSRRRGNSQGLSDETKPPLPPKVPNELYQNSDGSSSTANILDDLKALQEEVDKIRDMAGGF